MADNGMKPLVDPTYVSRLLTQLKDQLRGLHTKMSEVEAIRHLEDKMALSPVEKASGLEVRIGAAGELIENVKAALTTNIPVVHIKPLRDGPDALENSSLRERFWGAYLADLLQTINEVADSQTSLGVGVLKGQFYPWPKEPRQRGDETKAEYRDRQKALKRQWGPPFSVLALHPMTCYFRPGAGGKITELVEHGYKPKHEIDQAYGISDTAKELTGRPGFDLPKAEAGAHAAHPDQEIRGLPAGTDTSILRLVTEYWRKDVYQVYVEGKLVHQEREPGVQYFPTVGRTSISKDPDKMGVSVAEIFRHNEPTINRTLTRMAEATELLVQKRLTLEVPEGYTPEYDIPDNVAEGETNEPQPRTWTFDPGKIEALPAQAKVVDPFDGVEHAYEAMPFIELMLRIMGNHGVSPIFKGIPPGSAGSGYRDNSLYLMAKSQFQYLLDSFERTLAALIVWLEEQVVRRVSQEIFQDDLALSPRDIEDYPVVVKVEVEPLLPQNLVTVGAFYDRMHARGHATRRMVLEKGMREEQPDDIIRARMFEDIQEMLKPILYQDVLQFVGIMPPATPQLVGPDGKTPITGGRGGAFSQLIPSGSDGQGEAGQSWGGRTRQGAPREPPEVAGTTMTKEAM